MDGTDSITSNHFVAHSLRILVQIMPISLDHAALSPI